ncbi:biotin/lipoate--protein ligase family protein [Thalassobaculum sp.]|uniref:biotin/lipoate--protein ligase family protein n=1 Tax=Thalassobaculum sp. TaxID=2022740 RepID=UPI0032EEF74D
MTIDDGYEAGWPPLFPPLLTGREVAAGADPMATAVRVAAAGADPGVFVFAGGDDLLRFAVTLAPEVPLERALQMAHALMIAVGDSIGALAPPEVAVEYRWPTTVLVNGAAAGRVRLAAAATDPAAVPDWLAVGLDLRLSADTTTEPGERPGETALYEEGSGVIPPARLLESMSRHFLVWLRRWEEDGFRPLHDAWSARAEPGMTVGGAAFVGLDEDGRALLKDAAATRADPLSGHLEAATP